MSIHEAIKRARKKKGWSMERLAQEVSTAEKLSKPLSWQTVQQWESGGSAPKRKRMAVVASLLGLNTTTLSEVDSNSLVAHEDSPSYVAAPPIALPSIYSITLQLAQMISTADASARGAIGELLRHMCESPEYAEINAKRIAAILSVGVGEGNAAPQKSSGTQR